MKVDASVNKHLNKLLKNELTAINQYFLHGRTIRHWGFERLGKKIYEESIGEMKHADHLIKRILLLDGLPNLQDLGKLLIGETVPECLKSDLKLEYAARTDMVAAIAHFETVKDYRLARHGHRSARGYREAHRLPGDRAGAGAEGRPAELPADPDRRRVAVVLERRLFGRHQVAFAGGDRLVEDLAHRIDAGAALRRRALAAEHLLAAGCAGAGGGADLVVVDAIANADDHAGPVTMRTIRSEDTQERDPDQARMRTVRRNVRVGRIGSDSHSPIKAL